MAAQFGEAMLPSVAAILLGLDIWIHFMQDERKRLLCNLLNICIVSAFCQVTYLASIDATTSAYELVAIGYAMLFVISLIYINVWLFQCCKCDCQDNVLIRIIIGALLIIAGIVTSMGYFVLAADDYRSTQYPLFYIGLTIFVAGYSCMSNILILLIYIIITQIY